LKNYQAIVKSELSIKLLGMGDARYRRVKSNLAEALQHVSVLAQFEEIMELDAILRFHVSSVPAIIVEDKVVFERGDIPSVEELDALLKAAMQENDSE
jgi:hypothetical protein